MQYEESRSGRLPTTDTGTHPVNITFSAHLQRYAVAGVITLTGVDLADPFGTFAGNNATTKSASVTIPSGPDELVLVIFSCETCDSVGFTAPAEEYWNAAEGKGGAKEYGAAASVEGAGPNVTISGSLGKRDHWAMGGVAIRPAQYARPDPARLHSSRRRWQVPDRLASRSSRSIPGRCP